MNKKTEAYFQAFWEGVRRFGWFPLAVFLVHVSCSRVVDVYHLWPSVDIPLHFFGGMAFAWFAAGALEVLAGRGLLRRPEPLIRFVLVFSLTATAAVFWEFAEWAADFVLGKNCQLGLDDTMLDLFLGVSGAFPVAVLAAIRR